MDDKESRLQHIKDAKKALIELDTMKCNVYYSGMKWNDIVINRRKHIQNFLESLEE